MNNKNCVVVGSQEEFLVWVKDHDEQICNEDVLPIRFDQGLLPELQALVGQMWKSLSEEGSLAHQDILPKSQLKSQRIVVRLAQEICMIDDEDYRFYDAMFDKYGCWQNWPETDEEYTCGYDDGYQRGYVDGGCSYNYDDSCDGRGKSYECGYEIGYYDGYCCGCYGDNYLEFDSSCDEGYRDDNDYSE